MVEDRICGPGSAMPQLRDFLYYEEPGITLYCGDCREVLPLLERPIRCCVTSPPYWQLRSYGADGELGSERLPSDYVRALVSIFNVVRGALASDGAMWLNMGDAFTASGKGGGGSAGKRECWNGVAFRKGFRMPPPGYKMKDLTLVPFEVALRLRESGWFLRSVVVWSFVWSKPSATEPLRLDRPAVSHEYVFLMAKSEDYAVRNPGQGWGRLVWEMSPDAGDGHPAVMPADLASRCIASIADGLVLDPFAGAGTVLSVAKNLKRDAIGIEIEPKYCEIAVKRLQQEVLL